eukprot:7384570-Prymnesium_polylepis.1
MQALRCAELCRSKTPFVRSMSPPLSRDTATFTTANAHTAWFQQEDAADPLDLDQCGARPLQ